MRLNRLTGLLETESFPLRAEDFSQTIDGVKIEHPTGDEPLERLVSRCEPEEWKSADDAWLSMMATVDEMAIGRKFYTDRDPPCGPDEFEPVSF